MKTCTKCKIEYGNPEQFFSKKRNGLDSECKECNKKYYKLHYIKNKSKYKANAKRSKKKFQDEFRVYKRTLSCCICDENHPACLQFHHVNPEDKTYEVSFLLSNGNSGKIWKEIEKCVVMCANCHAKKHYDESHTASVVPIG